MPLINFPGTNINCKLLFKGLEATEIPLLESNHSLKGGRRRGERRYRSVQQVVARRTGRNYGAENDKWRSTTKFYSTHIPEEDSISLYIDAWISSRYRSLCIDTRVFVRSFVCLLIYLSIYATGRPVATNQSIDINHASSFRFPPPPFSPPQEICLTMTRARADR